MTMLETVQIRRICRPPIPRAPLVGGLVLATMLIIAACGDDDDSDQADPATVLADYEDARNAGDLDALMAIYAPDAVVSDHPQDDDGIATGVEEIRPLEENVPSIQRSEEATEFINVETSGDTATFDMNFQLNDGDCLGSSGHQVTIDGDKISQYDRGSVDEPCR